MLPHIPCEVFTAVVAPYLKLRDLVRLRSLASFDAWLGARKRGPGAALRVLLQLCGAMGEGDGGGGDGGEGGEGDGEGDGGALFAAACTARLRAAHPGLNGLLASPDCPLRCALAYQCGKAGHRLALSWAEALPGWAPPRAAASLACLHMYLAGALRRRRYGAITALVGADPAAVGAGHAQMLAALSRRGAYAGRARVLRGLDAQRLTAWAYHAGFDARRGFAPGAATQRAAARALVVALAEWGSGTKSPRRRTGASPAACPGSPCGAPPLRPAATTTRPRRPATTRPRRLARCPTRRPTRPRAAVSSTAPSTAPTSAPPTSG